jgi:MHS family proline/betaine transporter-like MFS transporter
MNDKRNQVFASAILGNILEYYDFTVYSVFSIVIGHTFFPESSELMQIIYSLGIFALGFITRPIGGIFFGYIGDHFGRRIALIYSMLGMTISTFAMGLVPGFEQIGYSAPVVLVILRLVQGLCISGEGTGSAIFVLEHFHNFRPGFVIALVQAANIAGTIIASLVGLVIGTYFPEVESAWRFAFLLGGLMGIVGFYLRLKVAETPIFEMMAHENKITKLPFTSIFKESYKAIIITFFVGSMASSIVYIIKTYINIFYTQILHLSNVTALGFMLYSSLVLMLTMPLIGALGDRIGKTIIIRSATWLIFFSITPVMYLISSENFYYQVAGLTSIGILTASVAGTAYLFIISLFKPEHRYSGVAFGYNTGIALFGSTSPIVSRLLVESTGLYYSPAFYIMVVALILLFVLKMMEVPEI